MNALASQSLGNHRSTELPDIWDSLKKTFSYTLQRASTQLVVTFVFVYGQILTNQSASSEIYG